jgi:hypothetical protein
MPLALAATDSPFRDSQLINFAEVPIPGNQNQFVTARGSGNPDVVLWKRPPFLAKKLPQGSIFAGHVEIAWEYGSAGDECLQLGGSINSSCWVSA